MVWVLTLLNSLYQSHYDMTKISEVFIFKQGRYFYIEYRLLNEEETEVKQETYKAIKYSTLLSKLNSLLKEHELC
jgi:hypothetical protein